MTQHENMPLPPSSTRCASPPHAGHATNTVRSADPMSASPAPATPPAMPAPPVRPAVAKAMAMNANAATLKRLVRNQT